MLSHSRQKAMVNGLTSVARKVFEAVPIGEAWTIAQVQAELSRTSGIGRDFRNVQGCLRYLTEAGLITQPEKDTTFRRVPVREITLNEVAETMNKPTLTVPNSVVKAVSASPKKTPLAILSGLATQMRALADEIEHAALEIEESFTESEKDNEKLKQLQTLLRSIGLGA